MSDWPVQIPYDLQVGLEGSRTDMWRKAFQKWAKHHGLELEVEWFRSLDNAAVELHRQHFNATSEDHWHLIRIWLKLHDVLPPDRSLFLQDSAMTKLAERQQ